MGQEATDLTRYGSPDTAALMRYGSPKERALELRSSIAQHRDRLGYLVKEMERRRRELFDVRLQLRRNAIPVLLLAAGIGGLVALAIGLRARRVRNESRLVARFHRARKAVGRAIQDPDRVAAPPPDLGKKVLIGVASAAATTLVTAVVKRIVDVVVLPPAREGARRIGEAARPAPARMPPRLPRAHEIRTEAHGGVARMSPRSVGR